MSRKWKLGSFLISLGVSVCFLSGHVTAQPSDKQLKTFRSAKTVRIVVDQSYGEAKDVSLPFEEVAGRLLEEYAGLKVVRAEAKDYDATLMIQAEGQAKGGNYVGPIYGYHYSGASLRGTISLEIPGKSPYRKTFKGDRYPPYTIYRTYPSPDSAPFIETLGESSFVPKILEIMGHAFGISSVVAALNDWDVGLRRCAAEALGEMKDPRAVEPLIVAVLKDEDGDVREKATEALGKIGRPAVEPLTAALKDEDGDVREKATEALGKIGHRSALPAVKKALNDKSEGVRIAAKKALDRLRIKARTGFYLTITRPYNTILSGFDGETLFYRGDEVFFVPKVEGNYGFGVSLGLPWEDGDLQLSYLRSTHDVTWLGAKSEAVYNMVSFGGKVPLAPLSKPTHRYLLIGFNYSWLIVKDGAVTPTSVGDAVYTSMVGISIGGGITYYLSLKLSISGEVRYRREELRFVKGVSGEGRPIDSGGSSVDLNVGVTYTF